jgi:hypothetical protein
MAVDFKVRRGEEKRRLHSLNQFPATQALPYGVIGPELIALLDSAVKRRVYGRQSCALGCGLFRRTVYAGGKLGASEHKMTEGPVVVAAIACLAIDTGGALHLHADLFGNVYRFGITQ